MRVILDTNVVISGIFFGGIPSKILDRWALDRFSAYASPSILNEYLRVIGEMGHAQAKEELAERWIGMLPNVCHMIPDHKLLHPISRDHSDDKFIACAMGANADYLVTGDIDLKVLPARTDFKIISPAEFLKILK